MVRYWQARLIGGLEFDSVGKNYPIAPEVPYLLPREGEGGTGKAVPPGSETLAVRDAESKS